MISFVYRPKNYSFLLRSAKRLKIGLKKTGGRCQNGSITAFKISKTPFHGTATFIDFWRRINSCGYIVAIKYDSKRTAYIAIICYKNGILATSLATDGIRVGDKIFAGDNLGLLESEGKHTLELRAKANKNKKYKRSAWMGNSLPIKYIPVGTLISAIELWNTKGAQLCRAAGTYAILTKKENSFATLKLRSGWKIIVSINCFATIGIVSNINHKYISREKAGLARNLGVKCTVRGVAMNAVDHPHGGGRGKSSGGRKPSSPWGKLTKWAKTTKIRKQQNYFRFK